MSIDTTEDRAGWAALFRDRFLHPGTPWSCSTTTAVTSRSTARTCSCWDTGPSELIGRPVHEFRADGRAVSEEEWHTALRQKQFTGTIELVRADGGHVTVEFAGHPETVTGRQLVLFVALRAARGGRVRDDTQPMTDRQDLSGRELEVVKLLAMGFSGPEVAEELRIAHNTVRTHTRNAMTKIGARSRAQLVAKSLGDGLYWLDLT